MAPRPGKRPSTAPGSGAGRDAVRTGEEPFGLGRRPNQQAAPTREGEHAASPGGGWDGAGRDGGGRVRRGRGRRQPGRRGGERCRPGPAADAAARDQGAPAGKAGSTEAAAQVRLVDLGNRIVRTANVDLEVGKGGLNDTVNRATDVVTRAKGIYVGSSTSVPDGDPASGQVTFRVPVDAFEPVLRELKALGTYRGEQSSTEDVTNQYVDLNGQLAAGGPRSGCTSACSTGPGRSPT